MTNSNKLDIWGDSIEGKHDCFKCGEYYIVEQSTAPEQYKTTYCSSECFEKDSLDMKMAAEAEARFSTLDRCDTGAEDENYRTTRIGDFILKVKKEQKQ